MRRVRAHTQRIATAGGVELPHQLRIPFECFRCGNIFDSMIVPKAVRIAESREARFGGHASSSQDHDGLISRSSFQDSTRTFRNYTVTPTNVPRGRLNETVTNFKPTLTGMDASPGAFRFFTWATALNSSLSILTNWPTKK